MNGELITREFDKGTAAYAVSRACGVDMKDTICFGDSMNDLKMMQACGLSICMADGAESLKAVSDMVCPSLYDDGIARAFEKLGLV